MNTYKILLVDDDININNLIRLYLEKEGFDVVSSFSGDDTLKKIKTEKYSLILLDVMIPKYDGWQILTEVRKLNSTPVIMLTAKSETYDKIMGLELGADDYITKPFDPKELIARIKAVLRRTVSSNDKIISYNSIDINMNEYKVIFNKKEIDMPPKEIELLYYLASHPNIVFTREQLLENVWGFEFLGDSRTVDVHIKRIREKLDGSEKFGWNIKTIWRVGYKFESK